MPSGSLAVLALNCFTKSMIFTPCGPRAVPTGGAGVALAAGNCNLMTAWTFFAIRNSPARSPSGSSVKLSHLFDLHEIQFDRRGPAKNRYRYFQRIAIRIHVVNHACKIGKRPFDDAHLLVALEDKLLLWPVAGSRHAMQNAFHFCPRKRRRRLARTDKSRDPRCVPDDVPGVVVHIHFHEHVAWVQHPR